MKNFSIHPSIHPSIHLFLGLIFFGMLFVSCSQDQEVVVSESPNCEFVVHVADEPEFADPFDADVNEFAKAVSRAVRDNRGFSKLVKSDVLVQFDGDYDVLLSTVSPKKLSVGTRGAESTVADFLSAYYPEEVRTRTNGKTVIEELQDMYPNLQISVPVHAEEWNPETYTPIVAFRPADFEDFTTKFVPGYDAEGNFVWVDAVNIPDKPVIVVGESERVDRQGNLITTSGVIGGIGGGIIIGTMPTAEPATNLRATIDAENGCIMLSWDHAKKPDRYYIYRKASTESKFSYIGSNSGYQNRYFTDSYLTANAYYTYYVVCYGNNGEETLASDPSNHITVKAPSVPVALSDFSVTMAGPKKVLARWNNDQVNNRVVLESYTGSYQSKFSQIAALSGDHYIHTNPYPGTKTIYKAYRKNAVGVSDAKYDFVYVPHRDMDLNSQVWVKELYVGNLYEIESWIAGHPEFYLKVLKEQNGNTIQIVDQINLEFKDKTNTCLFNNFVCEWECFNPDKDWYSALTFKLVEYDKPSGEWTVKVGAQMNVKASAAEIAKLPLQADISAGVAVEGNFKFSNNGDDCGTGHITYFENPDKWIEFPNYSVKMRVSDRR